MIVGRFAVDGDMGHSSFSRTFQSKQNGRGQLFKVSNYLYVVEGRAFQIEVQESAQGIITAHAESTSDPHEAIRPVSGHELETVLESLTFDIDKKVSKW